MRVDRSELREGLAKTMPFLLSHHHPAERHRCYSPSVFGRRIHLCARCAGIYPGIALSLWTSQFAFPSWLAYALVAALPLPALVDWTITTFTPRRGYNSTRTATGLLLGFGYGIGLARVVLERDPYVLAVGTLYAATAAVLLYYDRNVNPIYD